MKKYKKLLQNSQFLELNNEQTKRISKLRSSIFWELYKNPLIFHKKMQQHIKVVVSYFDEFIGADFINLLTTLSRPKSKTAISILEDVIRSVDKIEILKFDSDDRKSYKAAQKFAANFLFCYTKILNKEHNKEKVDAKLLQTTETNFVLFKENATKYFLKDSKVSYIHPLFKELFSEVKQGQSFASLKPKQKMFLRIPNKL